MDRIALLTEVLAQNPTDAFARYGLAMEHSNAGDVERALEEFGKLLTTHPDYTAGYFMAAQTLSKAERTDEAKRCWPKELPPPGKPAMAMRRLRWKACSPNLGSPNR